MSKTIKRTEVRFCFNKRFRVALVTRQIRFRSHELYPTLRLQSDFGRFNSGCVIHAQLFKPNEISWPDSSMNRLLQSQAAFLASRVRNQLRDTIPFFDRRSFPLKSTLVFACLFFCKSKTIFLNSIIHTINNAKSNCIKKFRSPRFQFQF